MSNSRCNFENAMAGLYIHIPFCRKACFYCNFHFSVHTGAWQEMLQAILREAETEAPHWSDVRFDSIYFGGGTPSIIPAEALADFIRALKSRFHLAENLEFTLEANPDDVDVQRIALWQEAGVNRVSLGLQSFSDAELTWMNRAHHAAQSEAALNLLLRAGIQSVNVDLIYGGPLLSDEDWVSALHKVFSSGADHLSAYALTLEADTPYKKLVRQGKYAPPDEERQARQFDLLMEAAAAAGWEHYEISNLCKPGSRAKHNSAYWFNKPYLGLGPSAHSYRNQRRMWNVSDNKKYMQQAEAGHWQRSEEFLNETTMLNELLMTRIRLSEGLRLEEAEQLFPGFSAQNFPAMRGFVARGWAVLESDVFRLQAPGRHFADAIAAALMQVEGD
jgi:oxygen-independent coproporphyrinogen-3 oxidase